MTTQCKHCLGTFRHVPSAARIFCSVICCHLWAVRPDVSFWPRVPSHLPPSLCWPWEGNRDIEGYGRLKIYVPKNVVKAHRQMWVFTFGDIPQGQVVRHKCDNPPCVNPSHLELGSSVDNRMDAVKRGRAAKGEQNGLSKLTEIEVLAIRQLHREGFNNEEIAVGFGVRRTSIRSILLGRTWGHV